MFFYLYNGLGIYITFEKKRGLLVFWMGSYNHELKSFFTETDRQTSRQTGRQAGRQADRQAGRQTEAER